MNTLSAFLALELLMPKWEDTHSVQLLPVSDSFSPCCILNMDNCHAGAHENVLRYHTAWFESDYCYIQTELCDRTLTQLRDSDPSVSQESSLLEIMRQVSEAESYLFFFCRERLYFSFCSIFKGSVLEAEAALSC